MANDVGRKGSTVGRDVPGQKSGAKDAEGARGGGASAVGVLTGGPLTPNALVGLHQELVDTKLVHKVLSARKAGATLASKLAVKGRSAKQVVADQAFDWGPLAQKGAAAKGAAPDGKHEAGKHDASLDEFPVESTEPDHGHAEAMGDAHEGGAVAARPDQPGPEMGGGGPDMGSQGGSWVLHAAGLDPGQAPLHVARKASGDGLAGAEAGFVVDQAQRHSSGAPLDAGTRTQMESGFGRSFSDVKVHTDTHAAQASKDLNAHAFTVNNDVYFNAGAYDPGSKQGQRLIAHELAHVAQGAQGAARGTGDGPSVSSPSDSAEIAADRAADAVVEGRSATELGSAPASVLHRNALDDLERAATGGGSWTGSVDQADVVRRIRALAPADRTTLQNDTERMRRIARNLDAAHMIDVFTILPIEFRWRVYWLNEGGNLARMNAQQWQWLMGYATPDDVAHLRQYPAGYRLYLQNAPPDSVPPWDLLEGLAANTIHPNAQAVRNAVARLSAQQKEQLRSPGRAAMMLAIATHAGNAEETFRTISYAGFELKWSVYWINRGGKIGQLSRQNWGQLLAEADKRQFDELVGWADMWRLVQANCDPAIIQTVRQQTNDPSQITRSLDDQVQADALFSSLGPEGFLALCCQVPADVATNYGKAKARNKVMDVLNGLRTGPRLGDRAKANLRLWFMNGGETTPAILIKMFEVRFRVNLTDTQAVKDFHDEKDKKGNLTAQAAPWTADGLQRMWPVCEALPPAQVEGNDHLMHIIRNRLGSNGNAYYSSGMDGLISMGAGDAEDLSTDVSTTAHIYWEWEKNPDGSWKLDGAGNKIVRRDKAGNPISALPVQVSKFNATLRHEIGHAVDAQLNIMEGGWKNQAVAGAWKSYGSYPEFVDEIIANFGGLDNVANCPAGKQAIWRQAMINTMTNAAGPITFTAALAALDAAAVPNDVGPARALWEPRRWTGGGTGPWYNPGTQPTGNNGRRYQRAYDGAGSLLSYLGATRDAKEITRYQWRAPGEWFAEVYQVYYSEQEQGPNTPVGGLLRSRDADAANMMSSLVDRGHSPQDMTGGRTVTPAGTGTNTGTPR